MILVIIVVVCVAFTYYCTWRDQQKNYPPGPFNIPFLGSLVQRNLINTIVHPEFKRLGEQYGDIFFFKLLADNPVVVLRGHKLVKKGMSSQAFTGNGRPLTFKVHGLNRDLGMIFTDGPHWQQTRRFTLRALHDQGMGKRSMSDNINEEVGHVVSHFSQGLGGDVSVHGAFSISALNSVLLPIIGNKVPRDARLERVRRLVDRNVHHLGPSALLFDLFPWVTKLAPRMSGFQSFRDDIMKMVDLFRSKVEERRSLLQDGEAPGNLIDAFLQQQKKAEPGNKVFCDDNLRVLLKDLLIAGLETVSTTMEWVVLRLVMHPDVQQRIVQEIDATLGRDRSPVVDDMPQLPFTVAVLDEVQRTATVLPVLQHANSHGDASLEGFHIPKDSRIIFDFHSIHFDQQFWGDPEAFRPDRFLGDDGKRLRERLLPFGVGMRRCIGESHGRQSLFLFTVGILQKLQLSQPETSPPSLHTEPNLVLRPDPFNVRVALRPSLSKSE